MKPSRMAAGWKLNSRAVDDGNYDTAMNLVLSQKSGIDLMQNCDLPPPLKVFSGPDNAVFSSMNSLGMMGREDDSAEVHVERYGGEDEKLGLLKALRFSQTRAREVERKAADLVKERDRISNAFLEESFKLFAHRQWVKLLEIQVSKLKSQMQWQENRWCRGCRESRTAKGSPETGDDGGDTGGLTWFMALALCLGIAGVGFAFGSRLL